MNKSKRIELTGIKGKGKFAIVDDEDYKILSKYKWCYDGKYAIRSKKIPKTRKSRFIYMHRIIMKIQNLETAENIKGKEVDHIDNDGLNNQKINLRVCFHQQNRANSKIQRNNTIGYKGLFFSRDGKRIKRWGVVMKVNNKRIYIGRYLTKEDAAIAYNQAAKKFYGEFARLNIL